MVFDSAGQVDRIMSIFTNKDGTFTRQGAAADPNRSVIASVRDNLRPSETRNYYEIVPKGLYEDSLAYVDRPHEWNGVDERGIPPYLLGADYIKPFNDDKQRFDFRLEVTLAAPAQMYLFFDDRIAPPAWLLEEFEDTGDDIGIDIGPAAGLGKGPRIGYGPGQWVDLAVSVWRRKVTTPGIVVLGPNSGSTANSAMYGICAIAIDQ